MDELTEGQVAVALEYAFAHGALKTCEKCGEIVAGEGSESKASMQAWRDRRDGKHSGHFVSSYAISCAVYDVVKLHKNNECPCMREEEEEETFEQWVARVNAEHGVP
ncbi:hypothetical protein FHW69_003557 [Luteibacter sp. Sphag1AF]|uniref:hypothetical protein n=1 Tax=Luteibacter sp. Sphag1AF TaxID=2587031 RepID=UPI001616100C|nr:hypothetical protein [Luteibacter sp. Sphag1AF]MBB3228909.1 hypothetical protein [Luteibacter sp. Sphag1AF]